MTCLGGLAASTFTSFRFIRKNKLAPTLSPAIHPSFGFLFLLSLFTTTTTSTTSGRPSVCTSLLLSDEGMRQWKLWVRKQRGSNSSNVELLAALAELLWVLHVFFFFLTEWLNLPQWLVDGSWKEERRLLANSIYHTCTHFRADQTATSTFASSVCPSALSLPANTLWVSPTHHSKTRCRRCRCCFSSVHSGHKKKWLPPVLLLLLLLPCRPQIILLSFGKYILSIFPAKVKVGKRQDRQTKTTKSWRCVGAFFAGCCCCWCCWRWMRSQME